MSKVTVVGAGLAGSEAAWQIAKRGINVTLYEMRPHKMTPAHRTSGFSELVCSNSLRANAIENAVGLLKEEMRMLDSLVIACADRNRVPAGGALAVDREGFANDVTNVLSNHPNVTVVRKEIEKIPSDGIVILATGPLTSDSLVQDLLEVTGQEFLYFYDAASPIVDGETIDYSKVFWASRYDKGDADYLNSPLTEEEYDRFYEELVKAEVHDVHGFEEGMVFEGCMPVEVMAKRGRKTLLFGPMKPVGINNPADNKRPYAVVQMRRDNLAGTMFNLVGFQTHLKWGEQKRVFGMIPGLENAEFLRYGVMHRNTYINSPEVLLNTTQLKDNENIMIAGQLSGVEGYVESAAAGLVSGINASRMSMGKDPIVPPRETAVGSLLHYISHADKGDFQPMNVTFGLLPELPERIRDKKRKKQLFAQRALTAIRQWTYDV